MAVPVTITDLTTTVASNSPQGSDAIGTNADDYIRALSAILKESGATLYTATGTDTITFSTTPTFSAYASGQRFFVKAAAANTGAVTVNINALGAKNVLKSGATALSAGDIPAANAHFLIEYDGTQFQLLNPATIQAFPVGSVGAPSIYMTGYATTGWYNIGANNWGFAVSGAKVLDIASTGLSVTGKIISTSNASVGSATSGVSYIKGSSAAVSTAAAGTLSYVMDANYTALVLISDDTSAKTALYLCGTDNVCTEISDPSNGFSPTNTGVVRVTKSGATITLTNDYGVSVNLAMTIVSAY